MNREIKFRGKCLQSGKWVYGSLLVDNGLYTIYTPIPNDKMLTSPLGTEGDWYQVDPKTVGQFTGITNFDKVKLFDSDILDFIVFDHNSAEYRHKGCIVFSGSAFEIWSKPNCAFFGNDGAYRLDWVLSQDEEAKVIGNIHDNPELLEEDLNE